MLSSRTLIALLAATGPALSAPPLAATLPTARPVPGGIAVVVLPAGASEARFDGKRVLTMRDDGRRYAVVGIPLDSASGARSLVVSGPDGRQTVSFEVESKDYGVQRLSIGNRGQVSLSPEDLERVKHERKVIDRVYAGWTPVLHAELPFALPVEGDETSTFGVRRVLNGKPRAPHSGIDLAAPAGTPVDAPADGMIALTGDFFFNGRSVFIDHGEGLISVYVHLSEILVEEGEAVQRGDTIGKLGASGRTTGADLHWTVTLNGTYVNPELLLSPAALQSIQ